MQIRDWFIQVLTWIWNLLFPKANRPPIAAFTATPTTGAVPFEVVYDASASSDPEGALSSFAWDFGDGQGGTGVTVIHRYASAGKYVVTLTVTDNEGASSSASQTITISGVMVPPDPTTVAPALDQSVVTSLAASTEFLYIGDAPIQTGVASGTIIPTRAAVLKGRVINRDGTPLAAVQITVLHHPEFGSTLTRSDGMFDLAVNGGGLVTINYAKDGYLPVHRQLQTPWQDYCWLPDVVLLPLAEEKTTLDLTAPVAMQKAQGSRVSDDDGTRQATLLIPQGTQAEMVLPDGTSHALTQVNIALRNIPLGPPVRKPCQQRSHRRVDIPMRLSIVLTRR